jgi:hypothetical protein
VFGVVSAARSGFTLGLMALKNTEYEDEFEYEYDRRTKTILEVRGERKPRPRRGSFLLARNRSSIVLVLVLVLVLVSAIGCKREDVGVPKSNKLALMGIQPGLSRIAPSGH